MIVCCYCCSVVILWIAGVLTVITSRKPNFLEAVDASSQRLGEETQILFTLIRLLVVSLCQVQFPLKADEPTASPVSVKATEALLMACIFMTCKQTCTSDSSC